MGNTQYSKATKETAENLRIIDDAMFRLVAERKEACQEILRTLLDRPQLRGLKVTPQCVITSLYREIVLDVLCILKNGAYTPKGTDFSDIPQVVILYITEYDALHNGQMITRVKRCMDTQEGYVPVDDGEEIFFANTVVRDDSDKSELLQFFLRKDAFEDVKFPELSRAVKYFKETEGGFGEMCKTVEDYAKNYAKDYAEEREKIGLEKGLERGRSEERMNAIRKMLQNGFNREMILSLDYSETELEAAEKELIAQG